MAMVKGKGLTLVETDKTEYNNGNNKDGLSVFSSLNYPISIYLSHPK